MIHALRGGPTFAAPFARRKGGFPFFVGRTRFVGRFWTRSCLDLFRRGCPFLLLCCGRTPAGHLVFPVTLLGAFSSSLLLFVRSRSLTGVHQMFPTPPRFSRFIAHMPFPTTHHHHRTFYKHCSFLFLFLRSSSIGAPGLLSLFAHQPFTYTYTYPPSSFARVHQNGPHPGLLRFQFPALHTGWRCPLRTVFSSTVSLHAGRSGAFCSFTGWRGPFNSIGCRRIWATACSVAGKVGRPLRWLNSMLVIYVPLPG